MQPDDMHVFLKENSEDKAYMTLSPVTAPMNGVETPFMGVGCVCSAHPGEGYGHLLITSVNKWIEDRNYNGLLFCKKELIKFYMQYGWKIVATENVFFNTPHTGVFTMTYNCGDINRIDYSDRLF